MRPRPAPTARIPRDARRLRGSAALSKSVTSRSALRRRPLRTKRPVANELHHPLVRFGRHPPDLVHGGLELNEHRLALSFSHEDLPRSEGGSTPGSLIERCQKTGRALAGLSRRSNAVGFVIPFARRYAAPGLLASYFDIAMGAPRGAWGAPHVMGCGAPPYPRAWGMS